MFYYNYFLYVLSTQSKLCAYIYVIVKTKLDKS